MASVAALPGVSAWKSSTGRTSTNRRVSLGVGGRPLSIACQEKLAGRPAMAFSKVSETRFIIPAMLSSVKCFIRAPINP